MAIRLVPVLQLSVDAEGALSVDFRPALVGEMPTFGIFVGAKEAVPFDPARNRIFVRFTDGGG